MKTTTPILSPTLFLSDSWSPLSIRHIKIKVNISMAKIITIALRAGSILYFAVGVGLIVPFSPIPASAATPFGVASSCSFLRSVSTSIRFQCIFPTLTATSALHIQYVSARCVGGAPYSLREFQVFTTPPNSTSEVPYQIQITNQASLGPVVVTPDAKFVVTAGSQVDLYAKAGSQPRALIDVIQGPLVPTINCAASLSGLTTP